ncbi:hypothetical protein, partial [Streptosporangium sp. NPDC049304]|uniref:hypothetical protein n=1 Tax=Streptosporangium sp. NPDC049304 TaxID=3154830 RepID=UPI00341E2064
MVMDPALLEALEKAAEREKGLRQRGKTPKTATPANPATMRNVKTETNDGGYDGGYDGGAVCG